VASPQLSAPFPSDLRLTRVVHTALLPAVLVAAPAFFLFLISVTGSKVPAGAYAGLAAMLLALTAIVHLARWRDAAIGKVEIAYVAFIFVLVVATLVARTRFTEVGQVPQLHGILMLILWTSCLFTIPALLRTRTAIAAAIAVLDLLGVLIALTVLAALLGLNFGEVQGSELGGLTRVFGPFGDSVAFVLAFFLVRALVVRSLWRIVLFAVTLFATASIGAALVLLAAVGFLALDWVRRNSIGDLRVRPLYLLFNLAALVALGILAGAGLWARITDSEMFAYSMGLRLGAFQLGVRVVEAEPLIGAGYNGFSALAGRFQPESFFDTFSYNYIAQVPNQYLQTAADAGVLGLIALIVLLWFACRTLRAAAVRAAAVRASPLHLEFHAYWAWCLGLVFGNQSAAWLLPYSLVPVLFFTATGLAIAWLRATRNESAGA